VIINCRFMWNCILLILQNGGDDVGMIYDDKLPTKPKELKYRTIWNPKNYQKWDQAFRMEMLFNEFIFMLLIDIWIEQRPLIFPVNLEHLPFVFTEHMVTLLVISSHVSINLSNSLDSLMCDHKVGRYRQVKVDCPSCWRG
jgi:hypothetical protein